MKEQTKNRIDESFRSETSYKIVRKIEQQNGSKVKEIVDGLDITRSTVSSYLKVLKKSGIVVSEKDGRSRIYFINYESIRAYFYRILKYNTKRIDGDTELLDQKIHEVNSHRERLHELLVKHTKAHLKSNRISTLEDLFLSGFLSMIDQIKESGEEIPDDFEESLRSLLQISTGYDGKYLENYKSVKKNWRNISEE